MHFEFQIDQATLQLFVYKKIQIWIHNIIHTFFGTFVTFSPKIPKLVPLLKFFELKKGFFHIFIQFLSYQTCVQYPQVWQMLRKRLRN